ncbi:MAG TPA: type II and III secretion system protein family protein [Stellaceae bacterium]|nr:type II and III secretion system protein family protein [Stellaceae bacterium]
MSRIRTALVIALTIFCATAAAAQTTPPAATPPAATPPAAAPAPAIPPGISQVPASGKPIVIEAGKGTLIRLSQPAATVFIANPDIADVQVKSPSLIYLSAKSPGETVVYAVDANDQVLLHAPVRVDQDLTRVRESLHALMPGENIGVTSIDKNVVLNGDVTTASRAEKARALAASIAGANIKDAQVLNQLSVDTPNQVNLRVKIAEVNRTALKALGFNWSGSWSNNRLDHSTSTVNTANPFTNQAILNQNLFTYGFSVPGGGPGLQATLDALASEGLITTLAEPNLTATSGQTASFLAGGEFPVPVAASTGTTGTPTITIEFKQFGVALDFVPTILDGNHISLKVRPEVSQLTTTGAVSVPLSPTSVVTIPALTVRRAETTVELASGQSFALGGLLQNTTEQDISKIPWLGDIPVLGQLFRSNLFQHNETELVIIVTPYLVKPSNVALSAPTDGFILPHDVQRMATSDTYRQTLPAPAKGPIPPGGVGLLGPAGFKLD